MVWETYNVVNSQNCWLSRNFGQVMKLNQKNSWGTRHIQKMHSSSWVYKSSKVSECENVCMPTRYNIKSRHLQVVFEQLISFDEIWLHYYDPETKQTCIQSWHSGFPQLKKFKTQRSAGKAMIIVLFKGKEGNLIIIFRKANRQ